MNYKMNFFKKGSQDIIHFDCKKTCLSYAEK